MARVPAPGHARSCWSCGRARRNVKAGWRFTYKGDKVVSAACPDCPVHGSGIVAEVKASGETAWRVTLTTTDAQGHRRQWKRRFPTVSDAERWASDVRSGRAAVQAGGAVYDPATITTAQVCDLWLAHKRRQMDRGEIRPTTYHSAASSLAGLLGLIGATPARDLTPSVVETALARLSTEGGRRGKPLGTRSLAYALSSLRAALRYAQRDRLVDSADAALLANPPRPRPRVDARASHWSPEQVRAYVETAQALYSRERAPEAFQAHPWVLPAVLLSLCALRRSEVAGLRNCDVNTRTGEVTITQSRAVSTGGPAVGPPKTSRSARVVAVEAVMPGTISAVRALQMTLGRPPGDALLIRDGDGPVHPTQITRRFHEISDEAGLPRLKSIHATRHTVATLLAESGVSALAGASFLGHLPSEYLNTYSQATAEAGRSAALEAGRLLSG